MSQTANVSAKSSSGWLCAYQAVEMQDEALAVRLRRVELGVLLARAAEDLAPLPPAPERERVVDGVAGLVPEDTHAPLGIASLDLEHLREFELREARVCQVERDGDAGDAVRREPLVRQPVVRAERQARAPPVPRAAARCAVRVRCPRCGSRAVASAGRAARRPTSPPSRSELTGGCCCAGRGSPGGGHRRPAHSIASAAALSDM